MSYTATTLGDYHSRSARILVVDDEPAMRKSIVDYLNLHHFRASGVSNRSGLVHVMAVHEPDLILMDINLGDDDGLDLLGYIRSSSVTPVILMTGHLREGADRVAGLELGADDYLLKPFDLRELVARVRSNLRRRMMDRSAPARQNGHRFTFCGWTFDQPNRNLLTSDGRYIALTKGEYALLSTFVSSPRRALSRQHLLQATRVHDDEAIDRSIDVQILRLRRKLEDDPRMPHLIRTQRGVGYIFEADVTVQ